MVSTRKNNYISVFCVICLMVLMIIISMLLIVSGAASYRNLKQGTDATYNGNTALSYVINKIHGFDNGGIAVHNKDGIDYIMAVDDSGRYKTLIYAYDGILYENLMPYEKEFVAGGGNRIMQADNLSAVIEGNVIYIEIVSDGQTYKSSAYVNSNAAGEGNDRDEAEG